MISHNLIILISALQLHQFVFGAARPQSPHIRDVCKNPRLICILVGHLLHNFEGQHQFDGDLLPSFASHPINNTIPHCFLPQLDSQNVNDSSPLSKIGPPLNKAQERNICYLYGCTRILYSLTSIRSPECPNTLSVLVVTKPTDNACDKTLNVCLKTLLWSEKSIKNPSTWPDVSIDHIGGDSKSNVTKKEKTFNTTTEFQGDSLRLDRGPFFKPVHTNIGSISKTSTSSSFPREGNRGGFPRSPNLCADVATVLSTTPKSLQNKIDTCSSNKAKIELTSKKTTPSTICAISRTNKVIRLPPASLMDVCIFGCESLSVMHSSSKKLIRLLFVDSCTIRIFDEVIDSRGIGKNVFIPSRKGLGQRIKRSITRVGPTKTGTRLPIPAVIKLSSPREDRQKAIRKAMQKLRQRRGFHSFHDDNVSDVVYRWRKGKIYAVLLYFKLKFMEI